MSITYKCNNRCEWCYASSNEPQEVKELDRNRISPVLNLLKNLGIKRTILIGGEPTMFPYLKEVLEGHKDVGLKTGMVTNGRKLSQRDFSKMVKNRGIDSLTVSIEGHNSQSHDKITQVSGSYSEAIKGIYVANEEGIKVSTNTVITRKNHTGLERIADSLIELPIESIGFNVCGPCFGGAKDNSLMMPPQISSEAFQRVYDYIKSQSGKRSRLITPTPLCLFDEEHQEEFKKYGIVRGGPCQVSSGRNFVVDYNGDIVPCTHLTGYPLFNIYKFSKEVMSKEEFIESMNNPNLIPYKFRKIMNRNASKKCDDGRCDEPCSGGCPLFWSVFDPEKEIKGKDKTQNHKA
jgi:radical SAM protein with 4Fe4S-binding SPASM domain